MKLPSITETISFKLSALYLILFLCSFLSIGLTVYLLSYHTLEQQLKNNVEIEVARLKTEYDSGGLSELKDEIYEVDGQLSRTQFEYGVIDINGKLIAGHLNIFQPSEGWRKVMQTTANDRPDMTGKEFLFVRVMALPNNIWLGVGHNAEAIEKAGEAIIHAFIWGFVLVVFLGAGGGLYLSRAFLKKIEAITESTQAIIGGDLKRRLPVSKNRDELDDLALLLNQMLDKIGSLIENIQQVSSDIAHDLRTPISHLKFRLEDALTKNLSLEQYSERVAFAIEEIDTILDTFSAMLRISQIESGSRRSGFKIVDLGKIIISVADALTPVAEGKGKAMSLAIEKNITLMGDKELLTQMVFNLLDNAILHTPDKIEVTVSLRSSGLLTEFCVADNGLGIAEENRLKVFQRFCRLEQSRSKPGNGLGLSIAEAIVDLHGGTIALSDNKPGLKVVVSFCHKQSHTA